MYGAGPNSKEDTGLTTLQHAMQYGQDITLLEYGADQNAIDKYR